MERYRVELHTNSLILRTMTAKDVLQVAKTWDPKRGELSEQEALTVISTLQQNQARNQTGAVYHLCLAVCEKDYPETIIGWCGLDGRVGSNRPELFYRIEPKCRNKGYATECAKALLYYAFDVLGLKGVHGGCRKENAASARVMQKAGMEQYSKEANGDPLFIAVKNGRA